MPRPKKAPDKPSKPQRRPPGAGTVMVRADGRIAVVLPKELDPDRRPRYGPAPRRRFADRDEAVAWLDAEIARRRSPSPGISLDWTVRVYLAHWWTTNEARWPARTARNTRRMLRHTDSIGHVPLRSLLALDPVRTMLTVLTRAHWRRKKRVNGVLTAYGPSYPYAPSTIRQVRAVFHTALEALVPHVLPYNPVKPVRLAKTQDRGQPVWDADQLDRFEAKALEIRPDLYFPIRLVTRRALRRGEVLATKSDDLSMQQRTIRVDETAGDVAGQVGDTKGRKWRTIPLGELAEDARQHMMSRRARVSEWLAPSTQRTGKPFSLRQFNAVVKAIALAAGLDPITPKDMRATAATILLDQNVSLPRVSQLLGHSNVAITAQFYQRILRPNQARLDELGDDFDRAFRQASEAVSDPETAPEVSREMSIDDVTR